MHVEFCPDCETTLVPRPPSMEDRPVEGRVPEGYALGPEERVRGDELVYLGISGEPGDIRELSIGLSCERIRHWVIPREHKDPLAAYNKPQNYVDLFVLSGELERAAGVVRDHLWTDSPEDLDVESALTDVSSCPACSTSLPSGAVEECPECGLVLGVVEE